MAILLLSLKNIYTDILKGARTTFELRQCSREPLKCMSNLTLERYSPFPCHCYTSRS